MTVRSVHTACLNWFLVIRFVLLLYSVEAPPSYESVFAVLVETAGVQDPDDDDNYEDIPEPNRISFSQIFDSLHICSTYLLQHGLHHQYTELSSILETANANSVETSQQTSLDSFFSPSCSHVASSSVADCYSVAIIASSSRGVGAGAVAEESEYVISVDTDHERQIDLERVREEKELEAALFEDWLDEAGSSSSAAVAVAVAAAVPVAASSSSSSFLVILPPPLLLFLLRFLLLLLHCIVRHQGNRLWMHLHANCDNNSNNPPNHNAQRRKHFITARSG